MNRQKQDQSETGCSLIINGEAVRFDAAASLPTIPAVLARFGLTGKAVAVEVNRQLVSHRQYSEITLKDGDRVELVTLVGGG